MIKEKGYQVFENSLNISDLYRIKGKALGVFSSESCGVFSEGLESSIFSLKDRDFSRFKNCGLTSQNLIEIFELMTNHEIRRILNFELNVWTYAVTTKPVLLFSHPKLNEATQPHQDHGSMLSGNGSYVFWIPLVDCSTDDIGPLQVAPGSHKLGNLWNRYEGSFAMVDKELDFEPVYAKVGDVVVFDSRLVHKSGNNTTDRIRWSLSFRFADLTDKEWIESGT